MNATTLRTFAASAALAASVAAQASAAGGTWYVSPSGSSGATGLSENSPLASINEAISRASAGDTIYLLPGDYDEGGAAVTLSNSLVRVHVTKKLTIRSLGGRAARDATRIVGAWDAAATSPVGMGANSVRCAWIDMAASGTVFEDITFYRGATEYNNNSASLAGKMTSGGGAYQEGGSSNSTTGMEKTYFIDCAFVECSAPRGGGIYSEPFNNAWSVAAVRCLFKRCRGTRFGAGMRGGCAYFCVFDDCAQARNSSGTAIGQTDAAHAFSYGQRAVNCTFVNNEGYGIQVADSGNFKGGILNCLFQNNGSGAILNPDTTDGTKDGNTGNIAYNTERMEVFSPFDGDYRLTDIATAATAGDPQYLGRIPDAYRSTDYNGATIDASGATIAAGAVQEVLEEPSCGVGFPRNYSGTWTLDGEEVAVNYRTWRGVAGWPSPQHVGFAPNAGVALVRLAIGGVAFWPLPDNTAWTHPAQAGMASTLNATTTGNIYWADPVNGSDGNAGTEAEPFKTLNAAVQATTATHVVYAKAGDYASAEEVSFGVRNRVVVPDTLAGELRVIAVDGPENTFITGAADPANASQGIGSGAIRCIAVNSTSGNRAAFQGFTLRNGHADAAANTENSYGGALRNLDSATHSPNTAFLLDCVVRDCAAYRGGAVAGGTVLRSRFENCAVWFCGLFRYCTVVSSFVTGSVGQPIIDSGATAYNCTIYANNSVAISTANDANIRNCVVGGCTGGESDLNASALGASRVLYTLYSKNAAAGVANLNPAYVKMENPIRFIRPSRGNFRLAGYSAGLHLAHTGYMQSCMDIDGFPFAFDAATGDFQSGCYAPRPDDDDVMPTTFIIR